MSFSLRPVPCVLAFFVGHDDGSLNESISLQGYVASFTVRTNSPSLFLASLRSP